MPLVTGGQNLFQRQARHRFAEFLKFRHRFLSLHLPAVYFRHDARDGPAVPGDKDGFALLNFAQETRQVRLGVGCLNFAHWPRLTGRFD
jgi:hypothetical protein